MVPARLSSVLALATLAAGCSQKPPATQTAPPSLPAGRLQMVSSGVTESRFVGLDDQRKGEGVVQATVLLMGSTPTSVAGKYALVAKREIIDCGANRTTEEVVSDFDAAGKPAGSETINTGRMGRPMEASETEGPAACGQGPKGGMVVTGWKAAQRAMQAPPETFAKTADAKSFDDQAWLCAATVRARLSKPDPDACDRALALKPDDPDLLMDHGYKSLVTQKIPAATADFSKIIAGRPDSAGALFGRSLAAVLGGNKAAGKADHDKALQLDPKVAAWAQATYKVYITDPYL